MLTSEELKVLVYLRQHRCATAKELLHACLAGAASPDWLDRVVANLDWLGYVAVLPGPGGAAVQLTEKGRARVAAGSRPRSQAALTAGRLPAG